VSISDRNECKFLNLYRTPYTLNKKNDTEYPLSNNFQIYGDYLQPAHYYRFGEKECNQMQNLTILIKTNDSGR